MVQPSSDWRSWVLFTFGRTRRLSSGFYGAITIVLLLYALYQYLPSTSAPVNSQFHTHESIGVPIINRLTKNSLQSSSSRIRPTTTLLNMLIPVSKEVNLHTRNVNASTTIHQQSESSTQSPREQGCSSDSLMCILCAEKVAQCSAKFDIEVAKYLQPERPTGKSCKPQLVIIPCNSSIVQNSGSSYLCTRDIVIKQYNYHSQFDCIVGLAKKAARGSGTHIPRIGHSVFYFDKSEKPLKFHYHLSMLSLIRYLQPKVYFFWNNGLPSGRWWIELMLRINSENATELLGMYDAPADYSLRFYSIYREPQREIYGTRFTKYASYHASDVNRIEFLVLFGGVYLDFDAFAVKNLEPLLNSGADWIMGYELDWCCLNNGVLFGAPNASFGKLWHCEYADSYNPDDFTHHSVWRPHIVAQRCPHLIQREAYSLNKPNNYGNNRQLLYGENVYFNLSNNFVVHGWMWQYNESDSLNPTSILSLKFTLGRIWRHLYYSTPLENASDSSSSRI